MPDPAARSPKRLHLAFDGEPARAVTSAVATTHAQLDLLLAERQLGQDARDNIAVAAGEAVANAVEHGAGCGGSGVQVELFLGARELLVEVRDRGPGFDPVSVPDPRDPDRLFAPRGRGLLFMKSLSDEFECTVEPDGCVVALRWIIDPKEN